MKEERNRQKGHDGRKQTHKPVPDKFPTITHVGFCDESI